ncbi:MAG: TIGR03905 family TSCPD domain-containing protein [Clostridia bacterium]|nr:TIGR03905 family TSCPD domain-containing protein [Clostridia bacterium]
MKYKYYTQGTCSTEINFDLVGNKVSNVSFVHGCNGNLQAVSRLVDGLTVDEIESKLKGINCNGRGTSCGDQLARAIRKAYNGEDENGVIR